MNLEIVFGALADSLSEQLGEQGFAALDAGALEHLQHDADALVRLAVRNVLPDSAVNAARRKLIKRICALRLRKSF